MKVLIILSKSRICENMLGILGMTFLCVLENGWKPCRVFVKAVKTLWLFWKHCGALIVWKVFKNLVGFSSISKKDAEIFWKNLFDFSRKSWNFFWNFVEKPFFFFFLKFCLKTLSSFENFIRKPCLAFWEFFEKPCQFIFGFVAWIVKTLLSFIEKLLNFQSFVKM